MQHIHRRLVDVPDLIVAIEHNDASLEVFDDFLVQRRKQGHVALALLDQLLTAAHAHDQVVSNDRGGNQARAQQSDLGPATAVVRDVRDRVEVLGKQAQRRQGREQYRQRLLGQQPGNRNRNDQQHAESAGDTPAGVHQQDDNNSVAVYL